VVKHKYELVVSRRLQKTFTLKYFKSRDEEYFINKSK
jgi:hypothetical protein